MLSIPDSRPKTLPMADIAHATAPPAIEAIEDNEETWAEGLPHILMWTLKSGPVIPDTHRFTLFSIGRHAAEDGWAYPSMETLARQMGCTRQTLSRRVHLLEDVGLLEVETEITNTGTRNRYRLTGVYRDWAPFPRDSEQPATIMGAYRALVSALRAEVVELQEAVARKDEAILRQAKGCDVDHVAERDALRGDVAERDEGMSQYATQRVVVDPDPDIDESNTTTTTPTGDVTRRDIPPGDSRFHRVSEFVYREDVWDRIGWSRENPRGWRDRKKAIRWYLGNFDQSSEDQLSFLEQEYLYSREAELEAQTEQERQQREAEDVASMEARVMSLDPQTEAVWGEVQEELAFQVPKPMFETWIRRTKGVSMDASVFVVGAPTRYAVEWLERRQYHAIQTIVGKVTGQPLAIEFTVLGAATFGEDLEQDNEEVEGAS